MCKNSVIERPYFEKLFLEGKFELSLRSIEMMVGQKAVNFFLILGEYLLDIFLFVLEGVSKRESDRTSDHGFKFLFLLNFISIISN